MAEPEIQSLSPNQLAQIFQSAGYRAEITEDQNNVPHLRSASGGIMFNVRFGNRAAPPVEGFLDYTFVLVVRLEEGDYPLDRVNDWNRTKRFGRLQKADGFLVLDMDVIVAGGVTDRQVRGTLELWDRLIQELVAYLRGPAAPQAANVA